MKKIGISFLILIGLVVLSCIVLAVDCLLNNGEGYRDATLKKECDFVLPPGYKIEYSEMLQRYAIKVGDEKMYLWQGTYGIRTVYSEIAEPATFKDTCKAKSYLKEYLKQQQSKF